MMKAIQIPYCFYPDAVGGTEIYVETLVKSLQAYGIESVVCAPAQERNETFFHNGFKVRRFKISDKINDLSELYGEGDVEAAHNFEKILEEEKPDLVHLHAFTTAASLRLVREAKRRNIPTFFTYHTPTVSCQRGTLMYMGKEACDGRLYSKRCAWCALEGLGLPKEIAGIFGLMPETADDILGKINFSGGIFTAMRMKGLISKHMRAFSDLMAEVNYIVTLCDWSRDILLHNNVSDKKIAVIGHGLSDNVLKENKNLETSFISDKVIKCVYIGRLGTVKGIDILIRAITSLPDLQIELHIYGIIQSKAEEGYLKELIRLTKNDSRIVFKNAITNDEIIPLLKNYDVLVVPSQWLETGPLVVLEAFAAGVPVIGSNLGGIAELVEGEVNGLLVAHNSMDAWCRALKRISENRELVVKLRSGIRPPKTMLNMAREMEALYKKAVQ